MKDKKLESIEQILMIQDPVRLIKMGAPLDEYDSEALDIFERINRYNSVEKIHQIVYDVFVSRFGGGDKYKMVNRTLVKVGEVKPTMESAKKIIGSFEQYREIAEQIKKIIGDA